ncbi:MAG: hypothetical protein ACHQT9_04475 [Candidatus Saccharimonadales bacterium]
MITSKSDERGFGPLEGLLVVVIIAAIGVVGWYVYSHRTTTSTSPVSVSTPSSSTPTSTNTPISSGTTNSDLQSDLSTVNASASQSSQDINASNSALNDKSTFTAVP